MAGPAALLVAKAHKLGERLDHPTRLNDKDAHDAYRILRAMETKTPRDTFARLLDHQLSSEPTREALDFLRDLFAAGPDAPGSTMAGGAEEGVGEPEQVATAVSILAGDLLESVRSE